MNRRYIRITIALITVALIGLVGIQAYWIHSALVVRNHRFEQNVSEALSGVATKLRKARVASRIERRLKTHRGSRRWFMHLDSLKQVLRRSAEEIAKNFGEEGDSHSFRNNAGFQMQVTERTEADSGGAALSLHGIFDGRNYRLDSMEVNDFSQLREIGKRIRADIGWQMEAEAGATGTGAGGQGPPGTSGDVVGDIFRELFHLDVFRGDDEPDGAMLDSLIRAELAEKGVDAPYDFGVLDGRSGRFTVLGEGAAASQLLSSKFRVNLEAGKFYRTPQYLVVHFPNRSHYLLKNMRMMMGTSTVLLLVIIFSFYYTISTILRQKKLSDIRNDFVNNMTHEFKTPISTISLACEALGDAQMATSGKNRQHYVGIIRDENRRLGIMAENILRTAILDKGELKLKMAPTDVHAIITEAIRNINVMAERRSGRIVPSLDASVSVVEGDGIHLTNVIYNLLDNALKYCDSQPEIRIFTRNSHDGLFVAVQDNGIGISKEAQKKVFDKLYRVPTGNIHNVKGFGLGLSYVKTIMEMHGGRVTVESQPGKGSTFELFLPFGEEGRET